MNQTALSAPCPPNSVNCYADSAPAADRLGRNLQLPMLLAIALIATATIYRLAVLSIDNFWLDELFTLYFTDPKIPLSNMFWERWLYEVHPPLYYFIIYAWRHLTSDSEFMIRLPSLLAITAYSLSPLVYSSVMQLDRRLFLSVLLAGSFGTMYFGLEARSYGFLMLCAVNMTLLFCACLGRMEAGKRGLVPRLAALSAVSTLGAAFHFFGVLLAMAIFLVLSVEAVFVYRRRVFAVLSFGAVTGLLAGLWPAIQLTLAGDPGSQDFWLKLTGSDLRPQAWEFVRLLFGQWISTPLVGSLTLLAIFLVLSRRSLPRLAPHLITICVIVITAATIVSFLYVPVLVARYFTVLFPAIFIVLTDAWFSGIRPLWSRWLPPAPFASAAIGFAALAMATSWPSFATGMKEDWKRPADILNSLPECRGMPVIVIGSWRIKGVYAELHTHYLSPSLDLKLIEVGLSELNSIPWPTVMASQCPVKLWAGHLYTYAIEKQITDAILQSGYQLKIVPFKLGLLAVEQGP